MTDNNLTNLITIINQDLAARNMPLVQSPSKNDRVEIRPSTNSGMLGHENRLSRETHRDVLLTDRFEDDSLYVITRTGKKEPFDIIKIQSRIQSLINRNPAIQHVDATNIILAVSRSVKNMILTTELDDYTAAVAANISINNPNYLKLAARIAIDNHQKNTSRSFMDKTKRMYLRADDNGEIIPLISKEYYDYVEEHQDFIEATIDYKRDFLLDYMGFNQFKELYGVHIGDEIIERPQDMFMRTAITIHSYTLTKDCHNRDEYADKIEIEYKNIKEAYDLMSNKYYTHASPTYFNSGHVNQQLASCFLLGSSDSCEGIMKTGHDAAIISKYGGGIGIHVHNWRGAGALIRGTNGKSNGIVPFLRIYNNTLDGFDQGGRRKGSAAIYLMIHHPDIMEFLSLRLPSGNEKERARDLFYAIWIPDIFMERLRESGTNPDTKWTLFDPNVHCDLSNYFDGPNDKNYTNKYLELEKKYAGRAKQVSIRELWTLVYNANVQTGMPYICFSDSVNKMSNHINLGIIKSSNLCTEIFLHSDDDNYAVCNLCSINLSKFIVDTHSVKELEFDAVNNPELRSLDNEFPTNPMFDFKKLAQVVMTCVNNLNHVIDKNFYPKNAPDADKNINKTQGTNMRNRPIGIGVQGLADVYYKMRYPYASEQAKLLNKQIFEIIYYAAMSQSTKLAKQIYKKAVADCNKYGSVAIRVYPEQKILPINKLQSGKPSGVPTFADCYNIQSLEPSSIKFNEDGSAMLIYKDSTLIPKTIGSYPSMVWNSGAPISHGTLHWQMHPAGKSALTGIVGMEEYESLISHIKLYGVRNSQVVALMPTASTAALLGSVECFEPMNSNMYKRKVLAGEFIVINKYLVNDLYKINSWKKEIKDIIVACEGSIHHIDIFPNELKQLYKTAWEIDMNEIIQQAIDRQPFVDQGQSLNWFVDTISQKQFNQLVFKAWRGGLKTGKYYLRSKPAMKAQKFTIDPEIEERIKTSLQLFATKSSESSVLNIATKPIDKPDDKPIDKPDDKLDEQSDKPIENANDKLDEQRDKLDSETICYNTEQYKVDCLVCSS